MLVHARNRLANKIVDLTTLTFIVMLVLIILVKVMEYINKSSQKKRSI